MLPVTSPDCFGGSDETGVLLDETGVLLDETGVLLVVFLVEE